MRYCRNHRAAPAPAPFDAVVPAPDEALPGVARTLDEGCRSVAVSPALMPACAWTGALGPWQSEEMVVAADATAAASRWNDNVRLWAETLVIVALLHLGFKPAGRHRRHRRVWLSPIRRRRLGVPAPVRHAS